MANGKFDIGDHVCCNIILVDGTGVSFCGEIVEINVGLTLGGEEVTWYDVRTTMNDHWMCREDELSLIAGG